jgi:Fic family protein
MHYTQKVVWRMPVYSPLFTVIDKVVRKHHFWMQNNVNISCDRQGMILKKLMDHFEGNLTSSKWTKISADTALRDRTDVVNKGVLIKTDSGGRSTNYELNW